MALSSSLFLLLLSVVLVFADQTARRPKNSNQVEGDMIDRKRQQRSVDSPLECQEGNPPGTSFSGKANQTASGRTCQVWSTSQPHVHGYTEVGDHNHCRNPDGDQKGVWCYTTDPDKRWEHCSVQYCAVNLKVLDFTADSDQEPDSNDEYTSATLEAGPLSDSFTICSAFMVEAWTTKFVSAKMFTMLDKSGLSWGYINLFVSPEYTQYQVRLDQGQFVQTVNVPFFPLQWTHVCLSVDSMASNVTLVSLVIDGKMVVDRKLLQEEEYQRKYKPSNISLLLGRDPSKM